MTEVAKVIARGKTRAMDLGVLNGRYFINNSAAGLEPYVTLKHEKIHVIRGLFRYLVAAVQESWRRTGGDLDIQERVPAMMERCGLEVREILPVTRIARPGTPLWDWPRTFFRHFLPTLERMQLIGPRERLAFEHEWEQRSADPTSFLFVPPMVDIIGVKP